MLAPLENLKAHKVQMIAKAKDWAEQLRPNLLHKHDVLPLIWSTIMKKLEYPMALATLDAQQWTDIMSPVLQVCLPKAGVCCNFPRDVVFALLSYQCLGLPHPFGCQVLKHFEMLLRHLANRTKTGDYMEATFQAHQLETGTSFGILQQAYNNTAILASDTWMKRVWHRLEGLDIYVACDSPALSHRCMDDSLQGDLFINLEVDQDELLWLNWCRMFLQDQSPYQSKLIGLLVDIMAVDWLLQQWPPNLSTCPKVRIACEDLSFENHPLSPMDARFDLVSSIREAILWSSVDWSPQHVYC
ncbi:unnamed protein product [Cylindrotheca closterium]|uniref:Uncharacterized protein n=1 Tax=Cylindrotheca closterium TaxID=2856 RepID=A0AAD2PY93_9STRA|nr:unnamed protein product [Cylindrotheca closterium]